MGITQPTRRMPRFLLALIMLAAGLAAGLGAMAVASGSAGEAYYACVNNSSGTIKMISEAGTCGQNELRIVWNQQGPKGDPGEPGEPGEQGEPGTSGVSQAFTATGPQFATRILWGRGHGIDVATLSMPAGSYVIHIEARLSNGAFTPIGQPAENNDRYARCEIDGQMYSVGLTESNTPGDSEILVAHITREFNDPTTIALTCYVSGPGTQTPGDDGRVLISNARITAIQVDAIN